MYLDNKFFSKNVVQLFIYHRDKHIKISNTIDQKN